ncbi:MAG: hypothetical protein MJB14_23380 [Spirochaetes bacterium]|nr:hypothetical protein [Spirochaetota bacterium]
MDKKIGLEITHLLPGRLRVRLSSQLIQANEFERKVMLHPGIKSISYNSISRSVLFLFDEQTISQAELILRIAIYFSIENNHSSVQLSFASQREETSYSSYFSGLMLIIAAFSRLIPGLKSYLKGLESVATISTVLSVLAHGFEEIQENGTIDPEVVSIFYLLAAILQGKGFNAAAITWGTTFGRHLIKPLPEKLLIAPEQKGDKVKVNIRHMTNKNITGFVFRIVPTFFFDLLTGGRLGKETLIKQFKHVSEEHDQIIEGLSNLKHGYELQIYPN